MSETETKPDGLPPELHLVRDVLDNGLLDRAGKPLGRVDHIAVRVRDDGQAYLSHVESGLTAVATRAAPWLGWLAYRIGRRFGLLRGRPVKFAWRKVRHLGIDITLDIDKQTSPAGLWERWLQQHIVRHFPRIGRR